MPHDAVGTDAFVAFGEDIRQIDFSAGSGNTAVRGDNDVFRGDQTGSQERRGRQDDAGGIAARTGDQVGFADLFAITFGQAVNCFLQEFRSKFA